MGGGAAPPLSPLCYGLEKERVKIFFITNLVRLHLLIRRLYEQILALYVKNIKKNNKDERKDQERELKIIQYNATVIELCVIINVSMLNLFTFDTF